MIWLLQPHHSTRRVPHMWKLAATMSSTLALYEQTYKNHSRHFLRVLLRAGGKKIQKSVLDKDFDNDHWNMYIHYILESIWFPHRLPQTALMYCAWSSKQKNWYIGKSNLLRFGHSNPGFVSRFQEHVEYTWNLKSYQRDDRQYQAWRVTTAEDFFMVPLVWHTESSILQYERFCIQTFQAPSFDMINFLLLSLSTVTATCSKFSVLQQSIVLHPWI